MDYLRIRLAKETFKFSSTHFTILDDQTAERLHGHNYQVAVECELKAAGPFGMAFEFNQLKSHIKRLTTAWDEMVLIPKASPLIAIEDEDVRKVPHWVVDLKSESLNRSYRFPKDEVVFLEIVNITSEELARLFAIKLADAWRTDELKNRPNQVPDIQARVHTLEVTVEETRGQSATYVLQTPLKRTDLP